MVCLAILGMGVLPLMTNGFMIFMMELLSVRTWNYKAIPAYIGHCYLEL